MTFNEAKNFAMPFGKHKGRTLDDIAASGDGLRYLDWFSGERAGRNRPVDEAVAAYLNDPAIKKELEGLT